MISCSDMNAVSVKTNTVFVCKNLAEAQFRCVECCKAFISGRHLTTHNYRKHEIAPYFASSSVQTDQIQEKEQGLTDVTGRLEKAILLLEAKGSSLGLSTSNNSPDDTVRAKLHAVKSNETSDRESSQVEPVLQNSLEDRPDPHRKSVSLFTLPKEVGGWMTSHLVSKSHKMDIIPCGDVMNQSVPDGEDATNRTSEEDPQKLLISCSSANQKATVDKPADAQEVMPPNESKNIPREWPYQELDCTHDLSVKPLLIDLIKKLDTVFNGKLQLTNSSCQTSAPDVPVCQNCLPVQVQHDSLTGPKSVRFSDSLMYYESLERNSDRSGSDSCSSESKSHEDGRTIEETGFQTLTNYSAPVNCGPEDDQGSAEGSDDLECCPRLNNNSGDSCRLTEASGFKQDGSKEQYETESLSDTEHCGTDEEPEDDCCQSPEEAATAVAPPMVEAETTPLTEALAASHPAAALKIETASTPGAVEEPLAAALELGPLDILRPPSMTESQPKVRQSSDYVATKKQILDIVEKCVKDLKAKQNCTRDMSHPGKERISRPDGVGLANESCRRVHTTKTTSSVVCTGNENITLGSQGVFPPCTVICKDEELDIDELSGDSYERFMKRFYSRVSEPNPNCDRPPSNPQPQRDPSDGGRRRESALRKSEYAVLLHHETSQVQKLIDTLVSDLQRWRNSRRNDLSLAIRHQLEERLSSNLNILGIHRSAKLLSDSAAATAHLLLNKRRSEAKMVSTTYYDVLKYAFDNEVDRIAKSRLKFNDVHNTDV